MKRCLFSTYLKKKNIEDISLVMDDIQTFNRMERRAFSILWKNKGNEPPKGQTSLQLILKAEYGTNDYFTNSARESAKAAFSSAKETLSLYLEELKSKVSQAKEKTKELSSRLAYLQKEKDSLIKRSRNLKDGKKRKVKFASYKGGNESELKDGRFKVRRGKKETFYDNAYLFETQYLDPEIHDLKARIRLIGQRKTSLERKAELAEKRLDEKKPSVCFGSRKLFHRQFTGTVSKEDWCRSFRHARNRGMTISGRRDAAQGNFVFRYDSREHVLSYRSMSGKTVCLKGVIFPYGQDLVGEALSRSSADRQPVAWRIEDCGNAIRIKCTVELPEARKNNYYRDGCVGFDTNVDCLAVAETDGCGNLLHHWVIPFDLTGKTSKQRTQILSQAAGVVFGIARKTKKPIVMEDIGKIRQKSMYRNAGLNRKLNEFAHRKVTDLARSKSYRYSTMVTEVSPQFTSQAGKVKYMKLYGLSVHESAAFVIARRGMKMRERIPRDMMHLIPEAKRKRHHWSHWNSLCAHTKKILPVQYYRQIPYKDFSSIADMNQYFKTSAAKPKQAAGATV